MPKEDFFSKLDLKDYNNELEKIIEKKDFSSDVKNLLLSVLYKLDVSYEDYSTAKRDVISKKEIVKKLISDIDNNCDDIRFIYPSDEDKENIKKYKINKEKKKIETYPNEKSLLEAIVNISMNEITINDKYIVFKKSMEEFLNVEYITNSVEIIRDFNGWSWTTLIKEVENVWYNIIYQNLNILVGSEFLNKWIQKENTNIDYVEKFREILEKKYGKELSEEVYEKIIKIIVNIYIKDNDKEKAYINEYKKDIEEKLKEIDNKAKYLEMLSKRKKEVLSEIYKLDKIINDKDLLKKEFVERNKNEKEEKKIFSISYLADVINIERKELLKEADSISKKMNPRNIIKNMNSLKKEIEFIENLELNKKVNISNEIIELQKIFIKCYEKKIEETENKKDVLELTYVWRYYNFIIFKEKMYIKDIKQLEKEIRNVEIKIIEKNIKLKNFVLYTTDEKINMEIIRNIFDIKLINLQNIELQINKNITKEQDNLKKVLEIEIYDGETLEKTVNIPYDIDMDKKSKVKLDRKIKLFT